MAEVDSVTGSSKYSLGNILLACGVLSAEQLAMARERAVKKVKTLEEILKKEKLITNKLLEDAIVSHCQTEQESACQIAAAEKNVMNAIGPRVITAVCGRKRGQKICRNVTKYLALRRVKNALRVARRAENAYLKSLRGNRPKDQKDSHVGMVPSADSRKKEQKIQREKEKQIQAEEKRRKEAEKERIREEQAKKKAEEKARREAAKAKEAEEKAERKRMLEAEKKRKAEETARKKAEIQAQKEAERLVREEEKRKREQEKRKREEEAAKRKEEERIRRLEEEKMKKEEQARKREEAKRKKKEGEAARVIAKAARKQAKAERHKAFFQKLKGAFKPKKKERKQSEGKKADSTQIRLSRKERRRIAEEAKKEAIRQVMIEQEKQRIRAENPEMPEEEVQKKLDRVSTVLVDKPQEVTVSAPQGIVREVQPTIVQSASIDERQVFEQEKKRLLERIAELEKGAPVTEVKMDSESERKAIAAERAALEAERRALAEERKNVAAVETTDPGVAPPKSAPTAGSGAKPGRVSQAEKSAIAASKEEAAALKKANQELEAKLKALEEEKKVWETKKPETKSKAEIVITEKEKQDLEAKIQKLEEEKKDDATLAEERKRFEEEKTKLQVEREKLEEDKKKAAVETPKRASPLEEQAAAMPSTDATEEIRKEFEEKLQKQKVRFEVEREELIKEAAKAKVGVGEGTELTRIKDEAKQEAEAELARERTKWEIEKEKIKQQAIAEAESEFLSKMKDGGGMFGGKQKSVLSGEIAKWKEKAEKLERERLEVEKARALNAEQEKMREEEQRVEQEKLRLERERISKEKQALETEGSHEELLAEQREALEQERKELEEAKKSRDDAKKTKKKEKKKDKKEVKKKEKKGKKGKGAEAEEEEKPSINVGEILVAQNYLEKEELEKAEKEAFDRKVSVENILREEGLVTKEIIQNAVAEHYKMPFIDVSAEPPDTAIVEILPEELAMGLRATAIERKEDGTLVVATHNPERGEEIKAKVLEAVPEAEKVEMVYTSRDAIDSALSFYSKPLETRFQSIIEEHKKIAPEIIEEIFADAIQLGASDIHFEPQEKIVIVRFRVDGVMHEAGRLPKQYYEGIVNRIKIAGNMRIDEHFAAQDGAIRWKQGDRAMDVRVSIVPIVDGEKIVMRLLSEYVRTLTLRDLGFSNIHLDNLVKSAHKPFGMILTTGPTGSGKSTTLYGLLKIRNSPDVNISTIEDPVEYKIPGINHIQVNVKANLTFERGLRALVRQDPDIILVGEIRDNVTAQISVNAALTGHLLFSTLHANDAATAVPRLLEMGIEPYLLASTLELIIAQRLMRRTCKNCRYSYHLPKSEAKNLFTHGEHYLPDEDEITLYKGKGCDACGGTGFKGRVGVYELMVVTPQIEEMITKRRTSGEINKLARQQGMFTLFEDGLQKVISGLSTIDELLRVAAPPDPLASDVTPKVNVPEED